MSKDFQVEGRNSKAAFTLKVHRGDGMALLAMNWKKGRPPKDFVGFAIEYKEPNGDRFYALKNRLNFAEKDGSLSYEKRSTKLSPVQKFRWVHFPRNAELDGNFLYRVTPVFMNGEGELSYGDAQEVAIELRRETYPKKLNVTFTRGFISSQAFVDKYESYGPLSELLPGAAAKGLKFTPTHPKSEEALAWMGFEARDAIIKLLDEAIADKKAEVRVVAYDLGEPGIVTRLEKLGPRLKIIIDDDKEHGEPNSAESQAAKRLRASAGRKNVKRQHMGKLQHNKTIVVDGPKVQAAVCGSTNFSWRGFFVQSNNAIVVRGKSAIKPFAAAFDWYWEHDLPAGFGKTAAGDWTSLGLKGIDAHISFAPYAKKKSVLAGIAEDISAKTSSSLFYSLAFLYQTPGVILDAINAVSNKKNVFVYGISDRKVGGIDLRKPDGNIEPVAPEALGKGVPEPFKSEPTGGGGIRMHHKFLVMDFDKPTARVYLGSYNFSSTADAKNGENLLVVRDRRIAVSYVVEALRIFDHYHFRVAQKDADEGKRARLELAKPPRKPSERAWFLDHYEDARKAHDRELFA